MVSEVVLVVRMVADGYYKKRSKSVVVEIRSDVVVAAAITIVARGEERAIVAVFGEVQSSDKVLL